MPNGLSASAIKSWFQYRCERKTRYDMMTRAERDDATIVKVESGAAWAEEGDRFEERVLARLAAQQSLLQPGPEDEGRLGQAETIAFLKGETRQAVATQLGLEEGPTLRRALGLPEDISINRSFADLVFRESGPDGVNFRIVDIKATRASTSFHRAQVAFYALLLQGMLADLGVAAQVDPSGAVWHIKAGSRVSEGLTDPAAFPLKPYLRMVEDFFRRDVGRIAGRRVVGGLDETAFHLYFKCEQCDYLSHCRRAIEQPNPAEYDLSAVLGVSQEGKAALRARRMRTVGDLVRAGLGPSGPTSWSLQRRSDAIVARAGALAASEIRRLEDTICYLAPPRIHRGFYLLADHDAVEDNLITLGYRRTGAEPREVIRVLREGDPIEERNALLEVFGALIEDLTAVDEHNASADAANQLQTHIFIYEPSEAKTIQAAVGRHLEDPQVRASLLHAVRLFPPEAVIPEPEFRGAHHLPAAAIRSILEQLYALPCKVSYDLRQVSEVLHAAGFLPSAYAPGPAFRREFSSLLSMEVIRGLRDGRPGAASTADVVQDIRDRLTIAADLVAWLLAQNAAASQPFLRLEKEPFRFQATLDPFAAVDLDVLHAYELLESRSTFLETLVRLAQPARVRQQRRECLGRLTLVDQGRYANGRRWLMFSIPDESSEAEVSPDELGLILTDDSPDLRLNSNRWPDLRVNIRYGDGGAVFVTMSAQQYGSPLVQRLLRSTPRQGWFIDKTYLDYNGPRVRTFLQQLSLQDAP